MKKKPASAKSVAAKARREKMTVNEPLSDATRQRLEDSFERAYPDKGIIHDTGWVDRSYPSTASIEEADLLTADEANSAEFSVLGKPGVPALDDDVPSFLHTAAKAGPVTAPLDMLGRLKKDRKPLDAAALGETDNMPMITSDKLPVIVVDNGPNTSKRVVTIMRDHDLQYPDLYMAIFVVPDWDVPDDAARFARLFSRSGCYRADTVEEADLIVFGGGSDVEPLLYGEKNSEKHPSVYFNPKRDAADMKIYLQARQQGTPMMGVCRGAQFLHVMNGGKLYQDIDGHNSGHKGFAMREKMLIESVSSVHHQSCILNREGGMEVLMTTSNASTVRWLNAKEKDLKPKIDIEAFYYRDTGCFGVQGHPEYSNYNKFSVWCLEQVSNLFLTSEDFCWEDKRLQMTPAAKDAHAIAQQYVENVYNTSKEA